MQTKVRYKIIILKWIKKTVIKECLYLGSHSVPDCEDNFHLVFI
jgi:hypothetical protein